MSRVESFPIKQNTINVFVDVNEKKWKKVDVSENRYIFINLSMVRMQVAWVIPKLLLAKGLQEATGATPIAITWSKNPTLTRFFDSFGINHICIDELCDKNTFGLAKALGKTASLAIFHSSSEAIKSSKILNLNVGTDIYEDILRTSSLSTLRSSRNKIALKKYMHIAWALYSIRDFCNKHRVEYAIMDDMAYHEGAFIKLFHSVGAKVVASSNVGYEDISFFDNGEIKKRMYVASQDYKKMIDDVTHENVEEANQLIIDRFAGKNGRDIDRGAFAGKKVLNKDEMSEMLGLDTSKKTVAIMAHTFTDAVFNYGFYYFRDYYDWLDKTLELAEGITSVNWVLKPHPTRNAYNESADSIEDMYERHKKPHIFWTGDDISGESIKNIADMVVTIGGNVGAEYACFGIPSVIVGKPWYSGFGYTMEPSTYDEYKALLENAASVKKLTDEQVIMAKKLFYIRSNDNRSQNGFNDELAKLLNDSYTKMKDKMAISYFMDNAGTEDYNDETLKLYTEYIKAHDVKESQYYRKGLEQ